MAFGDPDVGDILVFHPPSGAESSSGDQCGEQPKSGAACDQPTPKKASVNFIKRVVGTPGDTIAVRNGRVIRNGNRGESDDSRFWGPVPTSWIIGKAFATYWPVKRIGSL